MSGIAGVTANRMDEVVIGTQTWALRNYDFGGIVADDDIDNIATLGKLYTWAEAMAIDITGWHLPTFTEIETLYTELGGLSVAGGKMKETGLTYWSTPNTGATNSSGFGGRASAASLGAFKWSAGFWTSTESSGTNAYLMALAYDSQALATSNSAKTATYSVRLIKD